MSPLYVLLLILWASIAAIIAGVHREMSGRWHEDAMFAATWPLILLLAACVGVAWTATLLGRVPVILVRRWRSRTRSS